MMCIYQVLICLTANTGMSSQSNRPKGGEKNQVMKGYGRSRDCHRERQKEMQCNVSFAYGRLFKHFKGANTFSCVKLGLRG
ncbi:hypothetical protein K402DRAFT_71652 [Aulographum hederae CBS 113979]|uniref:Secreted protein n=1 Tax=Aulographum hederae CBS 113979 TaxID=1176131 RepID=A0A6G1HFA8_9PEZI|nr:hypothetical protein K402DRAFT_71652 [Aulographum hederae CBS 113979]